MDEGEDGELDEGEFAYSAEALIKMMSSHRARVAFALALATLVLGIGLMIYCLCCRRTAPTTSYRYSQNVVSGAEVDYEIDEAMQDTW